MVSTSDTILNFIIMITSTFCICTYRDGRQYPVLNIHPKKYEMLYELGMYKLSKSQNIKKVIDNIQEVITGRKAEYELSTGDWCVVNVQSKKSIISNNFDEFEPIEIPTEDIKKLMDDWCDFILAYEKGEIPGIQPPQYA